MDATKTPEQAAESPREPVVFPRRKFDTDPALIADRADARALRLKPEAVCGFKRRHGLPRNQRLSPAALALLALELETEQRVVKGEQLERAQALALIAERATHEAAAAVAALLPFRSLIWVGNDQVEAYLLNRVEALTGKRYATAGAACLKAAAMAPAAAMAAERLKRGCNKATHHDRFARDLFWGVILRLDQLQGPPPADADAFYRWCQLETYKGHHTGPSLGDLLAGRMQEAEARALMQLPTTGPLDPGAIRSAYRAQARHHHPDVGGDRYQFERLIASRDRLLLEVG